MKYLFVLVAALVLAACGGSPAPTADAPTAAPVVPTAVPATATAKPTDAPTSTPKPTNTPAPPTPTPAPVELKGEGKTVTDPVVPPGGINRVRFTHAGQRNFIVTAYRESGDSDILANKIGAYIGQSLLLGRESVYFEVNADGPWSITLEQIYQTDEATNGLVGNGDTVSDGFAPAKTGPVPYAITHDGKRNFIARLMCAGGEDYVANEIGPVDGAVVAKFSKGPCIWVVQADGNWSLKPK